MDHSEDATNAEIFLIFYSPKEKLNKRITTKKESLKSQAPDLGLREILSIVLTINVLLILKVRDIICFAPDKKNNIPDF